MLPRQKKRSNGDNKVETLVHVGMRGEPATRGGSAITSLTVTRAKCLSTKLQKITRSPFITKFYSKERSSRGVQPFGVSAPHRKKSCLVLHIKYTETHTHTQKMF